MGSSIGTTWVLPGLSSEHPWENCVQHSTYKFKMMMDENDERGLKRT